MNARDLVRVVPSASSVGRTLAPPNKTRSLPLMISLSAGCSHAASLITTLVRGRSDCDWNPDRSERTKFSMTAGKAAGGLAGRIWTSDTGIKSTTTSFELDMSRLARVGTTVEVRSILRCSISCKARLAENSEAGGMKCKTASKGEAGGEALVSEVLPKPKKDDLRLEGSGRLLETGADMRRLSYVDSVLISLDRRYADGGAMLDRLLLGGGIYRPEEIDSAELVLDPAPIHDILGVDGPLSDARHCVAILAAFSSRDGSG
jgi:hypothetical protein